MFIHIGNGNVIHSQDVIAIIDYQIINSSTMMSEMVDAWKKERQVIGSVKNAKSIMITNDKLYFMTVSVTTLKKRASMIQSISNLEDLSDEVVP